MPIDPALVSELASKYRGMLSAAPAAFNASLSAYQNLLPMPQGETVNALRHAGYDINALMSKAEQPQRSVFQKFMDALGYIPRLEGAAAQHISGQDTTPWWNAFKEATNPQTPSIGQYLTKSMKPGWGKSIATFGTDVLLDPTTYIFWEGKLAKGGAEAAAKIGLAAAEKAGIAASEHAAAFAPKFAAEVAKIGRIPAKLLRQGIADVATDETFLRRVGQEVLVAKRALPAQGLKWGIGPASVTLVPGSITRNAGARIAAQAEKIPALQSLLKMTSTRYLSPGAFKPQYLGADNEAPGIIKEVLSGAWKGTLQAQAATTERNVRLMMEARLEKASSLLGNFTESERRLLPYLQYAVDVPPEAKSAMIQALTDTTKEQLAAGHVAPDVADKLINGYTAMNSSPEAILQRFRPQVKEKAMQWVQDFYPELRQKWLQNRAVPEAEGRLLSMAQAVKQEVPGARAVQEIIAPAEKTAYQWFFRNPKGKLKLTEVGVGVQNRLLDQGFSKREVLNSMLDAYKAPTKEIVPGEVVRAAEAPMKQIPSSQDIALRYQATGPDVSETLAKATRLDKQIANAEDVVGRRWDRYAENQTWSRRQAHTAAEDKVDALQAQRNALGDIQSGLATPIKPIIERGQMHYIEQPAKVGKNYGLAQKFGIKPLEQKVGIMRERLGAETPSEVFSRIGGETGVSAAWDSIKPELLAKTGQDFPSFQAFAEHMANQPYHAIEATTLPTAAKAMVEHEVATGTSALHRPWYVPSIQKGSAGWLKQTKLGAPLKAPSELAKLYEHPIIRDHQADLLTEMAAQAERDGNMRSAAGLLKRAKALRPETDMRELIWHRTWTDEAPSIRKEFADQFRVLGKTPAQVKKLASFSEWKPVSGWDELSGLLFPKEAVESIQRLTPVFMRNEETADFARFWNKLYGWWKSTAVTGFNAPKWLTQNVTGGAYMHWMGGVKNPVRFLQGIVALATQHAPQGLEDFAAANYSHSLRSKILNYLGEKLKPIATVFDTPAEGRLTMQDIVRGWEQNGAGTFVTGEFGKDVPNFGKLIGGKFDPFSNDFFWSKGAQSINDATDRIFQYSMFIDRLMKGDNFAEAAEHVRTFHFDYHDITNTERKAKVWIPFLTWIRKSVGLMARQVYEQPGKFTAFQKAQNALESGATPYPPGFKPKWLGEAGALRTPGTGTPTYHAPNLPITDLSRIMTARQAAGSLNPLLNFFIQRASGGKNTFTGEPMTLGQSLLEMSPLYSTPARILKAPPEQQMEKMRGAILPWRSYPVDLNKGLVGIKSRRADALKQAAIEARKRGLIPPSKQMVSAQRKNVRVLGNLGLTDLIETPE